MTHYHYLMIINRLPQKCYKLSKATLILASRANNSKRSSVMPFLLSCNDQCIKQKLTVFLRGYTIAMVTF